MRRMALLGSLISVLVLALACGAPAKVVPTVAPMAAPPPTETPAPTAAPPPTDTPAPSVQIQDLVGWWNLDRTQFFIRFDPDSRMASVMGGAELGLSGINSWDGPLSLEGGVVELQSRPVTPGSRDVSCDRNAIARYRVRVASPDKLEWSLIEDPCFDRRAFFQDTVYTRARPLEMLTGVWKAGSQDGATLTLRDNLLYQVTQSAGGQATPVVRGAYYWDAQLNQVVFFDEAMKPCGVSSSGAYQMAIDAEGRLTLTAVLDSCEERRRALSEWGPYTRVEAPAWAGRYAAQGAERFTLDLSATGVYVLRDVEAPGAVPLREGILDADGQRMRLQELMGEARCPRTPGEYEFQIAGEALTLAATNDPCDERKSFFASRPTWVRVRE